MPKKPLTDHAARQRIVHDHHLNLLVEAGAGSGKTHEMARRMAAGIASGAYDIEGIAAVTFTRKAASELRGRFHLALEKQLQSLDSATPDSRTADRGSRTAARERLNSALANLERFFAGTIHSFCAHLLRERPVEAGIPPGFSELDELEDERLRNQAWRDYLAQARGAGDPLMEELRDAGVKGKELDSAFDVLCDHDDVEFPPGEAKRPDVGATWARLDRFWAELQRRMPRPVPDEHKCKTLERAERFGRALPMANRRRHSPQALAEVLKTWDAKPAVTAKWWHPDPKARKRIGAEVERQLLEFREEVVTPFMNQWRQYLYRLIVTLLTRARRYAAAERRQRNSVNYNDLLLLTAKMLRENGDVRRALQRKHRWLFVDEFQDTDPVQAEILFLLAADSKHVASGFPPQRSSAARRSLGEGGSRKDAAVANWRTLKLRPGALFVVGDPKQSIYRFRRADIEIYNLVRQRIDSDPNGAIVELTTNFRSVAGLCKWANEVFENQFPSVATAESPKFAELVPNTGAVPKPASGIFTLTAPEAIDSRDVAAHQAEQIARYIRGEVEGQRRTYGSFLLLTRKKKGLKAYAEALEQLRIPMEVSGAGAFGDSTEVAELALLLRALSDPQDQVALVGVLRGALFGVSDQELFAHKQAGGWFSIFDPKQGDEEPSQDQAGGFGAQAEDSPASAVTRALATLHRYWRWTRVLPAGAALGRILEHSGYLALAATSPDGVEAGDLLHAIDRVRQVVEDGGSLADAAAALEDDAESAGDVESLPLEPGRTDVVRLMNLHKAKGLEAEVVLLADPCSGVRKGVNRRIVRAGDGTRGWFQIERPNSDPKKPSFIIAEPAGWDEHARIEQGFLTDEETRLLYVASTRAKEVLVVCRHAKAGQGRPWGALEPFLKKATELPIPTRVWIPKLQPGDLSKAACAQARVAREQKDQAVKVASWSVTSATAEAKHIVKMATAAEPASAEDPTSVVAADTPARRADAGRAWGTLIHGLLEHAMRFPNSTAADLRRLAMWLTVEEPQLRSVIDKAVETVQRVAKTEFWAEAQAGEHYEEAPFAVADSQTLTGGVIDLMFRSAMGWKVRDYKTDTALTASAYQGQLTAYHHALRAAGIVVADADLVHVREKS